MNLLITGEAAPDYAELRELLLGSWSMIRSQGRCAKPE
jgi:hypothetical protein